MQLFPLLQMFYLDVRGCGSRGCFANEAPDSDQKSLPDPWG